MRMLSALFGGSFVLDLSSSESDTRLREVESIDPPTVSREVDFTAQPMQVLPSSVRVRVGFFTYLHRERSEAHF